MKFLVKNTKIVSTFGPAVTSNFSLSEDQSSKEVIEKLETSKKIIKDLILSGINCVRFNFSHGFVDENNSRIFLINEVQKSFVDDQKGNKRKFLRPIVFMADTKGPEIRVFDMTKEGIFYEKDSVITINCLEKIKGSKEGFSVVDATGKYNMANDCIIGGVILVEDGKVTLEILDVDKATGKVKVKVKNNHLIKTNKRINLPGADYSMDFLSLKDIEDIKFSIDKGFDYVALSFVNSKKNVVDVRNLITSYCKEKNIDFCPIKIYSKIETTKSCENIDEIIESSDGIMIARGDLGLEIPYYEVPYWTSVIIEKCRNAKKPVIVATQMLDSLERNVVATRAEVSDVYRAAEMGTDCTMLSGETAQGMFPVLAVSTMSNIVFESEKHFDNKFFLSSFESILLPQLSEDVRSQCEIFMRALSKENDATAILISDCVKEEFLRAISEMKLSIPLFKFVESSDLYSFCDFKKSDLSISLFRGIHPVVVEGGVNDSELPGIFKDFLNVCLKDFSMFKKVLYFENGVWKVGYVD